MNEVTEIYTSQRPNKKFKPCGYLTLAASGKSFKLEIADPYSLFKRTYYINRDRVIQIHRDHTKEGIIYTLEIEDE